MFSAEQENDWTFQSVQSEFHRMLVSSKNIFQSRIALALHSLLSCIFAKSVFSHKVVSFYLLVLHLSCFHQFTKTKNQNILKYGGFVTNLLIF